jgi:hypothetical protein
MKYGRNRKKMGMLRGTKKKQALKAKKYWKSLEIAKDLPTGTWG